MCVLPELTRQRTLHQLESAASVYLSEALGVEFTPRELAQRRGVAPSTIYRRAARLPHLLSSIPSLQAQNSSLLAENHALKQRLEELETQLAPSQQGHWVQLTPERLALTTLEMTARHHSISDVQATLQTAFALDTPPSDGTLSAIIERGSRLAEHILDSVTYHYPLHAIEFDEMFHANSPILAALEPYSMSLVFLEQLGNCRAHTWKFAFDYRSVEPPEVMVHDCSPQGNLLLRIFGRENQLCIFHRIRNIGRELEPQIEKLYEKALSTVDERLWNKATCLEEQVKAISQRTHLLDFERARVRRFEEAYRELFAHCEELGKLLADVGLSCPSLSGLALRPEYLTHLKLWDRLAAHVEFIEGSPVGDGFALLDALAAVKIGAAHLEMIGGRYPGSDSYWEMQDFYLAACERLREVQAVVRNNGPIIEELLADVPGLGEDVEPSRSPEPSAAGVYGRQAASNRAATATDALASQHNPLQPRRQARGEKPLAVARFRCSRARRGVCRSVEGGQRGCALAFSLGFQSVEQKFPPTPSGSPRSWETLPVYPLPPVAFSAALFRLGLNEPKRNEELNKIRVIDDLPRTWPKGRTDR
jgi:hypothetical protein